jgi:hypothetical protein
MQDDKRHNIPIEDAPYGDGTVSDEDMHRVAGKLNEGVEGGQDHSADSEGRENLDQLDEIIETEDALSLAGDEDDSNR